MRGEFADEPRYAAVREGLSLIAPLTGLALAALARNRLLGAGLLGLAAWSAWFFRDPIRRCSGEPGVLYAAADGVITAVDEIEADWFVHGPALRIVTFLSPLDVHVNRSPAAGRIVARRREPGSFAPAFLVGGSSHNARHLFGLEIDPVAFPPSLRQGGPGRGAAANRLVVAQVAGFLARRIVAWRLPGDAVVAGQKLGMIRFGSRTDVLLPAGRARSLVAPGERVRAGLTPIARLTPEADVQQ